MRQNEITLGNCLDLIPTIQDNSLDAIVIDPPYGESMGYAGDNSLHEAQTLLQNFLRLAESKLKQNAHLAIFWTFRNLDTVIDCLREAQLTYRRTLTLYIPSGNARPYLGWLPRSQAIIIAQKYLPQKSTDFHTTLTQYLNQAIEKSGLSKAEIAKQLGCDSRLVMKWTRINDPSWCLPTPRFYTKLKPLLNLDDSFDILLDREAKVCRQDFEYQHDVYVVHDRNQEMLHPSQKPLKMMEHVVSCLCPRGGVLLDAFCGSGTVPLACKRTGRNFYACEINPEYHALASGRIHGQTPKSVVQQLNFDDF